VIIDNVRASLFSTNVNLFFSTKCVFSENNSTVSNKESTDFKNKYVNNKTRYVYTMPEYFQPNVKHLYTRFRIIFSKDDVTVGQTLFEFGFGIVKNKRFKSLMKTKCKTCFTNDGANIGF
jgi:hypothetical protein